MRTADWSLSAVTAGFLAVLVSYSGPLVIFYQAAQAGHMSNDMFASWVWGISIGAALSGTYLSWKLRIPVITAWSAPGTALLLSLFPSISMQEVVGAYITAAVLILALGATGGFERLMALIPKGVASGMMAGILFPFGLNAFKAVSTLPLLALAMIVAYLVFKRLFPRYCIVLLLLFGSVLAVLTGSTHFSEVRLQLVVPHLIMPAWSWTSTFSLALPLVLVTLTGQYLPGMTVLKMSGYQSPARPIITANSLASVLVAPFGGITIAIAAITAAVCTGDEAHHDPAKRYVAGIANGLFYLVGGMFGGTLVLLFAALPRELIAVLAGMALLGAIMVNLAGIVAAQDHREAALISFAATASGMTFLGLGSAFWGIVVGMIAHLLLHRKGHASAS
ncbi:benzoate/H(+) symporter BenE family transporter [Noviherbaspirillum pedocola]|uniref:Benzoate/H(+) symporter BenE family transporter n=1 Tax=Noviherbaspirillum pedocola TaxID=2801341 RepID=A0A934SVM6_9BURK|nr:benzoate/H(+) symporter BenE family transporter [Noviherbaspirillum pedocola]MBK4737656.1 benzoate/H(+) symporter BenE family transporter [Noviherbaspirillum pedocola]